MELLTAAVLGVVQGLTEFLPISSSAHLILARAAFGWDAEDLGLAFDVACHLGTLLAVVIYFRTDIRAMAVSATSIWDRDAGPGARLLRLIAIGTLPIGFVGLIFKDVIEQELRTPGVAAGMLAAGGLLLLVVERMSARTRTEDALTWRDALWVGLAQAAALVPGVSRSGATIAAGMLVGLRREAAARFAFLLGVPAILAAAARESLEFRTAPLTAEIGVLFAVGIATSAVVGYVTVKYFIRYLAGHALDPFAVYRLVLAAVAFLWLV